MNLLKNLTACFTAYFLLSITALGMGEHPSLNELTAASDAICSGAALNNQPFEKYPGQGIFTSTGFSVAETFKGVFGETVQLEHRGGELNGQGDLFCGSPAFRPGTDYLLFIRRREDGTLYCYHWIASTDTFYPGMLELLRQDADTLAGTGQDISDIEVGFAMAMNVLPGSTGYSSRFLQGDRGEPIEYIVDMDAWPAGITSNQALSAVSNAFAAWSEVTSLTFTFGGVESFGTAAPSLNNDDGRIYVQLHDNYGYISPSSTLAIGGRSYSFNSSSWPDGGLGGRVGITNEFDRSNEGYIVVEHSKTSLSTLSNFEEVLCHEVGHVLSVAHSSENGAEANAVLNDATMYYQAHFDNRAASLRDWDTNTIHVIYPANDTPPYGYDRVIRAISSPNPQAPLSSGVNQVVVTPYDLQGAAVATLISSTSGAGTFTFEPSNTVFYTPGGWYGDTSESSGYYDRCYIRMSDGVNLSPPVEVRVIQLLSDGNRDQLPNSWVATHGISGGASGDYDSDNFTNLEEWFLNSDPDDAQSNLEIGLSTNGVLSWSSRSRDLYQLQSTTNLANGFADEGNPILASSTNEMKTIEFGAQQFYRVQRLR